MKPPHMINIKVLINNIAAERLWGVDRPMPPVKITTNLNLVSVDKKKDNMLEVPFVFAINYMPAVAQISVKGKALVVGDMKEIEKIYNSYREKKPPPPALIQAISNTVFIESVIISRTINVPPPLPLPQVSPMQKKEPKELPYRT